MQLTDGTQIFDTDIIDEAAKKGSVMSRRGRCSTPLPAMLIYDISKYETK